MPDALFLFNRKQNKNKFVLLTHVHTIINILLSHKSMKELDNDGGSLSQ